MDFHEIKLTVINMNIMQHDNTGKTCDAWDNNESIGFENKLLSYL